MSVSFLSSALLLLAAAATVSGNACQSFRQYPGDVSITEFELNNADANCACLDWTTPPPSGGGGACDWQLSLDYADGSPEGSRDATPSGKAGNPYEILGMAFKSDATHSFFYVKSGQPLTGKHRSAEGASIDFGDLFINFGSKAAGGFDQAKNTPNMWGIHFTPDSDFTYNADPLRSGVLAQSRPGVYQNVDTISVTGENSGWNSIQSYMNYRNNEVGFGTHADGTPVNADYFDLSKRVATNINKNTGTFAGGFDYIIFNEDSLLPNESDDCSAYNAGTQTSTSPKYRYCANNPQALHHEERVMGQEPTIDPDNICNSPKHPDINCITPIGADPFPATWGQFTGSNSDRKAPLTPVYTFGIRVANSVFGAHATNGDSFRACIQLECGNDIACIDASFTCKAAATPGGGSL